MDAKEMILRKWDYQTHEYNAYEVSDNWIVRLYHHQMEVPTNCAQCGTVKEFGECYTSQEVHTPVGFGYAVCEPCYELESERRKKWHKR